MALAAMKMVSAGGFSGVSFYLRKCPHGVASVLSKKNPHLWVPTIKVRQPDGMFTLHRRVEIIHETKCSVSRFTDVFSPVTIIAEFRTRFEPWTMDMNKNGRFFCLMLCEKCVPRSLFHVNLVLGGYHRFQNAF